MAKSLYSTVLFLLCISWVSAQEKVLSLENTLDIIRQYHPVAKQSMLLVDMAEANLQASRGAFDPSFYSRNERKTFDGKNYYNYTNPELKIPTWFGINVKAGFENNQGDKINPEITPNRSTYVGISFPVLKGLLLDQRRAVLQQSKLMVQKSKQEQLLLINDLLFDAADVYWKWVSAYQVYNVLTNAVAFNEKRFEFVKLSYKSETELLLILQRRYLNYKLSKLFNHKPGQNYKSSACI